MSYSCWKLTFAFRFFVQQDGVDLKLQSLLSRFRVLPCRESPPRGLLVEGPLSLCFAQHFAIRTGAKAPPARWRRSGLRSRLW